MVLFGTSQEEGQNNRKKAIMVMIDNMSTQDRIINENGILRVEGAKNTVTTLKKEIYDGRVLTPEDLDKLSPKTIGSLLKNLVRDYELNAPKEYKQHENFIGRTFIRFNSLREICQIQLIDTMSGGQKKDRIQKVLQRELEHLRKANAIQKGKDPNSISDYDLMRELTRLTKILQSKHEINLMTPQNIAICFGPNIFSVAMGEEESLGITPNQMIQLSEQINSLYLELEKQEFFVDHVFVSEVKDEIKPGMEYHYEEEPVNPKIIQCV